MFKKMKHVLCGLALIAGLSALDGGKVTANVGHYLASRISENEYVDVALTAAGAAAGGYAGAEIGAAIGSAGGPVGAIIGAAVGAL